MIVGAWSPHWRFRTTVVGLSRLQPRTSDRHDAATLTSGTLIHGSPRHHAFSIRTRSSVLPSARMQVRSPLAIPKDGSSSSIGRRRSHSPTGVSIKGRFYAISFAPSGSEIATGGSDNAARVWNLSQLDLSRDEDLIESPHQDSLFSSAWLDEETVCTTDNSGMLVITDVSTGESSKPLEVPCERMRYSVVSASPKRKLIAVGRTDVALHRS